MGHKEEQEGRPRPLALTTLPSRAFLSQGGEPYLSVVPVARWVGSRGPKQCPLPCPTVGSGLCHPILPRYLVLQLGGCGLLVTVSEGQPLLQPGFLFLQLGHGGHHPMHHGGRTRRPRQARAPPAAKEPPTYEQSSGQSAGQPRTHPG